MSFLRRLLSGEYRRAVAAEASGEYALAARHYALAGARDKVAAMHLLRAARSPTHTDEIAALRDALRWADEGTWERTRAARGLGRTLLSRARVEGVGTERDKDSVGEAALLLEEAGAYAEAGEAWESLGDDAAAARAYEAGGLVERMEQALARDGARVRRARTRRGSFQEYELRMSGGERDAALAALRLACDSSDEKGEYRRLLGTLERRRLAGGHAVLRPRGGGKALVVCGAAVLKIGRDPDLPVMLRGTTASRLHAEIVRAGGGLVLRDAGSRGGTWLADLPVAGEVPLVGAGRFRLGESSELGFRVDGEQLVLEAVRGPERGLLVLAGPPEASLDLEPHLAVRATVSFREGRPFLEPRPGRPLVLNGVAGAAAVQLFRDDVVAVDGTELEVA